MRRVLQTQNIFRLVCITLLVFSWVNSGLSQSEVQREEEQLDFANGLFQREFFDMALKEYQKYLKVYPEGKYREEAGFGIAESYFFKRSYDEAINNFTDFLEDKPSDKWGNIAYLRQGQSYLAKNKDQKALEVFHQVKRDLLSEPLQHTYDFFLGKAYAQTGDQEKAIEVLERAVKSEKGMYRVESHLLMGDIFSQQQAFSQAHQQYKLAQKSAVDETTKMLGLFREGEVLFAQEKHSEAADLFNEFLKKYPQDKLATGALTNLLSSQFNMKQYKRVIEVFNYWQKELGNERIDFQGFYILANAHLKNKSYSEVVKVMDQSLELSQLNPDEKIKALLKKVETYCQLNKFKKALDIINNQIVGAGEEPDRLLFLKAESYFGLKDFKSAQVIYEQLIQDYPKSIFAEESRWSLILTQKALGQNAKALLMIEEFLQKDIHAERKAQALYEAILIETKLENTAAAVTKSEEYLKKYSDQPEVTNVLYLMGGLYNKQGEYEKAIEVYNKFLQKFPQEPRNTEVHFLLGYNYQAAGQGEKALSEYRKIPTETDSQFYYPALKNMAVVHIENDQTSQAAAIFSTIVQGFENNDLTPNTYFWLAQQQLAKEDYKKALDNLASCESKELDKSEKSALFYFQGEALKGLGKYDEALTKYNASVSMVSDGVYTLAARLGKADSLRALGKFDEAGKNLEQLVEENPNDHTIGLRARLTLGEIEETQGRLESAIKYYMLVSVLYDDDTFVPQALYKAGHLLEKLGRKAESVKAFDELSSRFPESDGGKKLRVEGGGLDEE